MRYAKLAVGVLLAVAGITATVGAAFGIAWYLRCTGADPGSLLREVCERSSSSREAMVWVASALLFDLGAIVVIRSRGVPWVSRLRIGREPSESNRA